MRWKGQHDRNKGKSPYVRKNKTPFPYTFRRCEHRTWINQSLPLWAGKVCANCNIIMKAFERGS